MIKQPDDGSHGDTAIFYFLYPTYPPACMENIGRCCFFSLSRHTDIASVSARGLRKISPLWVPGLGT